MVEIIWVKTETEIKYNIRLFIDGDYIIKTCGDNKVIYKANKCKTN
jgi:hypothetical protein